MPDLEDIVLTVAAADRANFGAVARANHVSQSTVSRAVQRVESSLGVTLFDREGRSVRVLATAAPALEGLRSIVRTWNALGQSPNQAGSLSIFCTLTASQTIVPDVLAAFRREHPTVELSLLTGAASRALDAALSGEVDAAFAPLPRSLPQALVSLEVATTPLVAFCALDTRVSRTWEDVRLVLPRPGVTRALIDEWRRIHMSTEHSVQETETHEEVVTLTALGSGIGIVPRLVLESSALRPRLRELTPPARLPTMRIGLCAPRRHVARGPLALLWAMLR